MVDISLLFFPHTYCLFTQTKNNSILINNTDELVEIIEVQRGDYLGEDDIERFDDSYGRVKQQEVQA